MISEPATESLLALTDGDGTGWKHTGDIPSVVESEKFCGKGSGSDQVLDGSWSPSLQRKVLRNQAVSGRKVHKFLKVSTCAIEEKARPIIPESGVFRKSELSVVAAPMTWFEILRPPRTTVSLAMSPDTEPVPYL